MDKNEFQQIRPGATYIRSRAAAQGAGFDGGAWQYFILDVGRDIL